MCWDVLSAQSAAVCSLPAFAMMRSRCPLMGFYAKHVLPRIINAAMSNEETARLRAAWIPHARGEVLEVGIGSGLNLPFYSPDVKRIYGVEPSVELQRMARKRTAGRPFTIEFLTQSAEEGLPLGGACIRSSVITRLLCSIHSDPPA